jgi:hypothetical protein
MCAEGCEGDIPQESNSRFGTNVTMTFLPVARGARSTTHHVASDDLRPTANRQSNKPN